MEPKLTWFLEKQCRGPCTVDTHHKFVAGSGNLRIKCSYLMRKRRGPVEALEGWNLLLVENIDEEHRETSAQNFLLLAEMKLAQYLAENGI